MEKNGWLTPQKAAGEGLTRKVKQPRDGRVVGALGRSTGRCIVGVTVSGEDQVVDAWEGRRATMAHVMDPSR